MWKLAENGRPRYQQMGYHPYDAFVTLGSTTYSSLEYPLPRETGAKKCVTLCKKVNAAKWRARSFVSFDVDSEIFKV